MSRRHSMHDRLDELGIPHVFNDCGPGTRPVLELSELTAKANGKRFQLLGSGTARVGTPPTRRPRTRYAVEVRGASGEQNPG